MDDTREGGVLSAAEIAEALLAAHGGNVERDLLALPGTRAALLHEAGRGPAGAEIHDAADDIFIVLKGSAVVSLGGRLVSPVEVAPGEWRGAGLEGAEEREVGEGDVILIPHGMPHARHTEGREVTLLLVKSTPGADASVPRARGVARLEGFEPPTLSSED